jgi:hypothetical protein
MHSYLDQNSANILNAKMFCNDEENNKIINDQYQNNLKWDEQAAYANQISYFNYSEDIYDAHSQFMQHLNDNDELKLSNFDLEIIFFNS